MLGGPYSIQSSVPFTLLSWFCTEFGDEGAAQLELTDALIRISLFKRQNGTLEQQNIPYSSRFALLEGQDATDCGTGVTKCRFSGQTAEIWRRNIRHSH
jgi:hypothetical protein